MRAPRPSGASCDPSPVRRRLPTRRLPRHLDRARSDLERDFAAFVHRRRLPPPEINIRIDVENGKWFIVDFLWPSHQLAVETDSYQHHQGDVSFEDDHTRDL